MSFQMFKVIGWMFSQNGDWGQIALTISSFVLGALPMALPLALFFSAIYCASKWSSSSEYTALRSIGFSLKKLLIPIGGVGLLAGGLLFILYLELIPSGRAFGRKIITEIQSKAMLAQMQSGNFFTQIPRLMLFAEKIDPTTYKMENIFIYQDVGGDDEKIILATHGHLVVADGESAGVSHMKLWNGDMIIRNDVNSRVDKLTFKQLDYALPPLDYYFDVTYRAQFLAWDKIKQLEKDIPLLSKQKRIDMEDKLNIQSERLERVWQSVLCVFFSSIGFLCGLGHFRQSSGFKSVMAFSILIIYFFTFYFLESMAKKDIVAFYVPYATSLVVLMVILAYLLRKQRWVLGS